MNAQLQEAKWLIKNMRQRFDTILRVSQAIVERQRNFFSPWRGCHASPCFTRDS
jgi:RNA polymerase sigma-54 factor